METTRNKMDKPEIIKLKVSQLIPAEWNYKSDDDKMTEKLKKSIEVDKSAGIPAVRELKGKYEVIDGNHRLKAIKELKWTEVVCENFGVISKAKAVTIAKRRNSLWFEDDIFKLSKLLKDEVLKDFSIDELATFMPETKSELEELVKLHDFDFSQFDTAVPAEKEGWTTLRISLSNDQYEIVRKALDEVIRMEGYDKNADGMALEMICVEYMNTPKGQKS